MIQDGKAVLQIHNKADLSFYWASQNSRQYRQSWRQAGCLPSDKMHSSHSPSDYKLPLGEQAGVFSNPAGLRTIYRFNCLWQWHIVSMTHWHSLFDLILDMIYKWS